MNDKTSEQVITELIDKMGLGLFDTIAFVLEQKSKDKTLKAFEADTLMKASQRMSGISNLLLSWGITLFKK